jgi:hypothetical protein
MHFRRFSAIDRENPISELVDGTTILLDVSKNDQGTLEVAFHGALQGRVLSLELLERLLGEGRRLAEGEA